MPDSLVRTYVLLPRLPVVRLAADPLDLHALSTLPAFTLSYDQTLIKNRRNKTIHIFFPALLTQRGFTLLVITRIWFVKETALEAK